MSITVTDITQRDKNIIMYVDLTLPTGDSPNQFSHTIERISGVNFTIGGGAAPGYYLNFKAHGDKDYTRTRVHFTSEDVGSSVIRVGVRYLKLADEESHMVELTSWFVKKELYISSLPEGSDIDVLEEDWEDVNPPPIFPELIEVKSEEIVVTWGET